MEKTNNKQTVCSSEDKQSPSEVDTTSQAAKNMTDAEWRKFEKTFAVRHGIKAIGQR